MERYKKVEKIGQGGCGSVYLCHDSLTNKHVALKEIFSLEGSEGVQGSVIREISLLKEMEQSNIARLLDVVVDERMLYVVFEFMGSDLNKFIHHQAAKDPLRIKRFLHQILQAVAYFHSQGILLDVLMPRYVLFDMNDTTLKVADLGSSRAGFSYRIQDQGSAKHLYKAPELLFCPGEFSTAVDVWSVGCIFAEMVNQRPLFPASCEFHQLPKIFSLMGTPTEQTWPGVTLIAKNLHVYSKCKPMDIRKLVPDLEPAGLDLLSKMLCMDPRGRISASDALKHDYFEDAWI